MMLFSQLLGPAINAPDNYVKTNCTINKTFKHLHS
jgi:hypothetical protein